MPEQWDILDYEPVPDGDGIMFLMGRGEEVVIVVDERELMSNRLHASEDALADLAFDRLEPALVTDARVLVGGLGMGFTQAAALRRAGAGAYVVVAELVPAVIRWNEEILGGVAGFPLEDARSEVYEGHVKDLMDDPDEPPWTVILLDVDNGPTALTRPDNAFLYADEGIAMAYGSLVAGGVLAIWSAADDDGFTERLKAAGFEVQVHLFTEEGRPTKDGKGTHVLWTAVKPHMHR